MAKSCNDKIPNNRANIREKIDHFIEALEELLFNDEAATGWPKSKSVISNGYASKTMQFWLYVGKAKMCFKGSSFFFEKL